MTIEQVIKILCKARGELLNESEEEMFHRFKAKYGEDISNKLPEAFLGLVLEQNKYILDLNCSQESNFQNLLQNTGRIAKLEQSVRIS